jgi:membrane AbrB-like protein
LTPPVARGIDGMMPAPPSRSRQIRNFIETVATAIIGGGVLALLGVPAGWVSGALLAVAMAALFRRPMQIPDPVIQVVMFTLGVVLGSVVTPETLAGVVTWPLSIAFLLLVLVGVFSATASYLRFVHGWDALSALFAASPGAFSQVAALSLEAKVDLHGVVIAQTVRVVFLTVGLPFGLALLGLAGASGTSTVVQAAGSAAAFATLFGACLVTAVAFHRFHFPGGLMFGAMTASAILHGGGFVAAQFPNWLVIATMVGVGAVTGSRFANTDLRILARYIVPAFGSFAVGLAVTAIGVAVLTSMLPFPIPEAVVAFAPGGQDAMMILALALNLDPVYVGAHHVARFAIVSLTLPLLMRRYRPPTLPADPPPRLPDSGGSK